MQVSAPAASTAQQRSQKLADLMVANTRLGCSQQEAMAVAASLEAVIFAGSVDVSSKCRAQLMEVVKAIRSASSWLGLPKVSVTWLRSYSTEVEDVYGRIAGV